MYADTVPQLAIVHVIVGVMLFGYSVEYYTHMRKCSLILQRVFSASDDLHRPPQEQCSLNFVSPELGMVKGIVHIR